jgi:hypothetical protein
VSVTFCCVFHLLLCLSPSAELVAFCCVCHLLLCLSPSAVSVTCCCAFHLLLCLSPAAVSPAAVSVKLLLYLLPAAVSVTLQVCGVLQPLHIVSCNIYSTLQYGTDVCVVCCYRVNHKVFALSIGMKCN